MKNLRTLKLLPRKLFPQRSFASLEKLNEYPDRFLRPTIKLLIDQCLSQRPRIIQLGPPVLLMCSEYVADFYSCKLKLNSILRWLITMHRAVRFAY
jgi:hypothetical protein